MQLGDKKKKLSPKDFCPRFQGKLAKLSQLGAGGWGVKLPNSDGFFNEGQFVATNLLIGQV